MLYRTYRWGLDDAGRTGRAETADLPAGPRRGALVRKRTSRGGKMFEEGQLYSPVTQGQDGKVEVHLGADHPGFHDERYRARRNEIAAAANAGSPGEPVPQIAYADDENGIWSTVSRELHVK